MPDPTAAAEVDAVIAAAMPLLGERQVLGAGLVRTGGRNVVVRATLREPDGAAELVIIKRMVRHHRLGFTDWASLQFLADVAPDIAPRFREGDVQAALFIMDDLGGSCSLEDVLNTHDSAAALHCLEAVVRSTATLHAATCAIPEGRYTALRSALPEWDRRDRRAESQEWRLTSGSRFEEWLAAARVAPATGLARALDTIADTYAEPGEWLAFTHGDPAPTNNHVRDGAVRLLDFEYGGYRHALYDPTAWTVLCPMPDESLPTIMRAYREVVASAIGAATDDRAFATGWARMCAYRAVAILGWIPPTVFERDASWVGDWTMRAAALGTAIRLHETTIGDPSLAPLCDTASRLAHAVAAMWPDTAHAIHPAWPAFALPG